MKKIDLKQLIGTGLSSYQLKMIAVFFMTVDHIGYYLDNIPVVHAHYYGLRILGRIAAPLFLYMTVKGLHHTRSKLRYSLRLYAASVIMELANLAVSRILDVDVYTNIFETLFFVALYITLIEYLVQMLTVKNYRRAALFAAGLLASFALILPEWLGDTLVSFSNPAAAVAAVTLRIVLPSPFSAEYSSLFIAFGVILYFLGNKKRECVAFALLCLVSFLGAGYIHSTRFFSFGDIFMPIQSLMILALPFMALYNGQKGKGRKYFFYLYYPLHQYVLSAISLLAVLWL